MTTLIYTPGISVIIESHREGIIDVSDDVSAGSLTLRENADHTLSLSLENPRGKYDGAFAPNDRIAVQLKRFRWLQVFTGYLDDVPYFSAYPRPVALQATCTRKILKNWPWDRGSQKAFDVIHGQRDRTQSDGGMSDVVRRILSEVVGWPNERVHIGRVPTEWEDRFKEVYEAVMGEVTSIEAILGTNPILAGTPLLPGMGGVGSVPGASMNWTQLEAMTVSEAEVDVVLATIRQLESSNNYRAQASGSSASGAYQYTNGTWNNYQGYARAKDAPAPVQDARARQDILMVIQRYGNRLLNIPQWWYYPVSLSDPTWLDRIPNPGANSLTIRQYCERWGGIYTEKYHQMRGTTPSSSTPVGTTYGLGTGSTGMTQPSTTGGNANMTGILYPIPAGVNQLVSTKVGWGGYRNGYIPASAMSYTQLTGQGHPIAVEAWVKLCAAAQAAGYDLSGSMYRSYQGQVDLSSGAGVKVPGTSNHGWGLAIDVEVLVPGGKYPTQAAAFASPEYAWLVRNAYLYGFGHPSWARQGGSKSEPWHWEFFAIMGMIGATGTPINGVNPFEGSLMGMDIQGQMFAALALWEGDYNTERTAISDLLMGHKALMNDEPILNTLDPLIRTAGRSHCMAPNGDYIAWFPDYWGEFGLSGALELEPIEMMDFSVRWKDDPLITHQYVEGAYNPAGAGPLPGGIRNAHQALLTQGMATVSMPGLLEAVINMPQGDMSWLRSPDLLLRRFGARVSRVSESQIFGPHQEFWFAVQKFTRAWAMMFMARVPTTFMPELFPGMLLKVPDFGVQFYISEVTHNWDLSGDQGFTTSASVIAPSAMDGSGFFLLPKGGHVFNRGRVGGTGSPRPV